jgi:hypothetical protein
VVQIDEVVNITASIRQRSDTLCSLLYRGTLGNKADGENLPGWRATPASIQMLPMRVSNPHPRCDLLETNVGPVSLDKLASYKQAES